jgi:parallel beta-helix repeat protein
MLKNSQVIKDVTIGIILLFVGMCFTPVTAHNIGKPTQSASNGDWLYVGGSNLGNYTRIQDAVNDSHEGDTVFVFDDSSPYYESLIINKSITLMGENKDTTIIDGTGSTSEKMIEVTASEVTITELCIQHGQSNLSGVTVYIDHGDRCSITHNILRYNSYTALYVTYATYADISNNTFLNNSIGLILYEGGNHTVQNNMFIRNNMSMCSLLSHWNTIRGNTILYSDQAVLIEMSHYNVFSENFLDDNEYGFVSMASCKNTYYRNELSNNEYGILLMVSQQNTINENNFINNTGQAFIMHMNFVGLTISIYYKRYFSRSSGYLSLIGRNRWNANYWSDWESSLPRPIDRVIYLLGLEFILSRITGKQYPLYIFQYDWHPAQEPYDIS